MRDIYDRPHSIIFEPYRFEIVGLNFQAPLDGSTPYLDLTLRKGNEVRSLRFLHPSGLVVEDGFPQMTSVRIDDISARNIWARVRVYDDEAGGGGVSFWAADVVELDVLE